MFVSSNQIYVFLACLTFGYLSGVVFSVVNCIKFFIKNKWIRALFDFCAFMFVVFTYFAYSFNMNFPNFRIYMALGVFVGIVFYFKSFHIILAKIGKKFYNNIKVKKVKTKDERIKSKKANRCVNGGCCAVSSCADNDYVVSVDKH